MFLANNHRIIDTSKLGLRLDSKEMADLRESKVKKIMVERANALVDIHSDGFVSNFFVIPEAGVSIY